MKKSLCLLLSLCLCLTAALPAFADEGNSETAARLILLAKEKLSISDDEFEFENYYQNETGDGNRYNLNWESKDAVKSSSIHVEIGDTGTIYHYNLYDGSKEYGKPKYPAKSETEAMSAAKSLVAAIDAEKAGQTANGEITYNSYNHTYRYSAERVLGDLPVFGESISAQLDADTLKLMSYRVSWTEGLTAPEENLLSFEEGAAAYRDKLGYELFYQVVSEDNSDTVKLVYRSKYGSRLYIDAVSGEAVSYEDIVYENAASRGDVSATMDAESGGGAMKAAAMLSGKEQAVVDEIKSMLSKEKAEQIARGVSEFKITADYEVSSYSISKNSHGKYIGRISFNMEQEEKGGYRNVSIDVMTGEVVGYNGYDYYAYLDSGRKNQKKELTVEEGQKIALDFLKKYYPQKLENMALKTEFKPSGYSVSYQRTENGIKFNNNGARIAFDGETGEISSFNLEWTDAVIPQTAFTASLDTVYDKLLTADNFRCGYLVSYDKEPKNAVAKAVYQASDEPVYDAGSVAELDWRLRPISENQKQEYTDIAGHYAEEIVKKMEVMGVYYPGDTLRPNDAVTQREYLKLIAQVLYQSSSEDDEDLYHSMMRNAVLTKEEIDPDRAVTRLEGIRYLLNAMGYREFAQIPGIFLCPFTDIAEADKGYGAIAAGLGLVNSETDTFYAGDALRRGDSLIIIYHYLSR